MDKKEKEEIIKLYEDRLAEFGKDVKTMGWRSVLQQQARFKVLIQISGLDNKTILDVGCGFGDLYDFLKSKEIKLKKYLGVDLSPKLIDEARKLHRKEKNARFEVIDILSEKKIIKEYDYIIASGIFNKHIKDNYGYLHDMLLKIFSICKQGVSMNMTTDYVDYKDERLFYFNPEKVFSICKKITKRVCLRHDYMPYEFTIYLYKDSAIDEHNVFKEFSDKMRRIKSK